MIENKRTCSKINGKQNVKLKCSSIGFKNQFKQLAVPFKIYADFECNMKRLKSNDKSVASYTKKHQDRIPCSFATNMYALMISLANQLFFTEEKMESINLLM